MRFAACATALLLLAACFPFDRPAHTVRVNLFMEANGSFDLNGHHLQDERALQTALRDLVAKSPNLAIVLAADKSVPYPAAAKIMEDVQPLGVRIGMVGTDTFER